VQKKSLARIGCTASRRWRESQQWAAALTYNDSGYRRFSHTLRFIECDNVDGLSVWGEGLCCRIQFREFTSELAPTYTAAWSGVGLTDLIHQQLAPYTTNANTAISGPDVMLTSAQTQAVAMVIHELATNAAKDGALSSPDGDVSVSWDRTGTDATAVLTIRWRELDGRLIEAPVQSGYGLSLIRDLIPHELGGAVDLTFPPDGASCKIEFPSGEYDARTLGVCQNRRPLCRRVQRICSGGA
jgi:two-component sensor histidine kinase